MRPAESLPALQKQGFRWVAFDSEEFWAEERNICRDIGMRFFVTRRIQDIHDVALLNARRRQWPQCAGILPRIHHPVTINGPLIERVRERRYRAGRSLVTDAFVDTMGEWGRKRSIAWLDLERAHADMVPDLVARAKQFFSHAYPLLPGTCVRDDFRWPAGYPYAVGNASKVTDWKQWPTA